MIGAATAIAPAALQPPAFKEAVHEPAAEQAVLGSALLNPAVVVPKLAKILDPRDFLHPGHAAVYRVLLNMHRDGSPIDTLLLAERLRAVGLWGKEDVGGLLLAEAAAAVPTWQNAEYYATKVKDQSCKRSIAMLGTGLAVDAANGKPSSEIIRNLRADLEDLERGAGIELAKPIDIATLTADNPTLAEPIIHGVARRGETVNIIGSPKVGKSWMVYGIALCIAAGGHWLQFQCRRGRILLVDAELHASNLAHRIKTVAESLGIGAEEYRDFLDVLTLRGRLMDWYQVAAVLESIAAGTYDVVIFDAYYRFLPAGMSENDNAATMQIYNLLDSIARRLNCTIIVIHHASKGSQADKAVTDVGAGAGSQSRAADAHVILRAHEEPGCFVMEAAVRSFAPVEPAVLQWGFPLWQPVEGLDPKLLKGRGSKQEEGQREKDSEGIRLLKDALSEGPKTVKTLRDETGLSKGRCDRLLPMMEASGQVRWEETLINGGKGRRYESIK